MKLIYLGDTPAIRCFICNELVDIQRGRVTRWPEHQVVAVSCGEECAANLHAALPEAVWHEQFLTDVLEELLRAPKLVVTERTTYRVRIYGLCSHSGMEPQFERYYQGKPTKQQLADDVRQHIETLPPTKSNTPWYQDDRAMLETLLPQLEKYGLPNFTEARLFGTDVPGEHGRMTVEAICIHPALEESDEADTGAGS